MHVLQVAWEHPPRLYGGLGRHVEGLTAALAAAGARVTVLTPELDGDEGPLPAGVLMLRADPPGTPLPADRWVAEVLDANIRMVEQAARRQVRPDVVHVHDWMVAHAARIVGPALGVPVVATIHATERGRYHGVVPPGLSAWIDAQEQALVAMADRVVVCARHMREHVLTHLRAAPERTTVIANGVDVAAWRDVAPAPPADRPRVVVAARLEHEKGIHVLLEAVAGIACEVVIAGRGSHEEALHRQSRAAGRARVRFTGHLDQPALAALLRSADVAVVPSLYEPFGLSAVEAMAAGAPLVASRTGGLAEVVTDGSGLLVAPDDAAALRRAIRRVLDDVEVAARLAAAGARRAAALSWEDAAAAHLVLYSEVVEG